jgi:3-isopropylmalate dehydratase small subunit
MKLSARAQTSVLKDYGFRVILAPSYADVFYNNCFKNGILPATLSEEQIEELFKRTEKEEGYALVDLPNQTVSDKHGFRYKFEIAPARKEVLLKGLDDIGTSLQLEAEISDLRESARRHHHDVRTRRHQILLGRPLTRPDRRQSRSTRG